MHTNADVIVLDNAYHSVVTVFDCISFYLKFELQHKLHQQTWLDVLKDADAFQSVQVDVHGDLGFELVRQRGQDWLLVQGLLIWPQIIEPLDDTIFQLFSDLSKIIKHPFHEVLVIWPEN